MAENNNFEWEDSDAENDADFNKVQHGSSLLIQGLPQDTSEEQLELHFENPHRGGEIVQISINRENSSAIVQFKESGGIFVSFLFN